jgi:hypothetical protein
MIRIRYICKYEIFAMLLVITNKKLQKHLTKKFKYNNAIENN